MRKQPPPVRNRQVNPSQVLQLAVQLHQQGKLDQAEARYWAILNAQPNHFDAKHLLGVLRYQQGRHTEAVDLIGAALKLKPNDVSTLSNFGLVLVKLGQSEEALASYDKALSLKPDYAEAHNHRGTALNDLKRPEEALASYDKSLSLKPDYAEALNNRGKTLRGLKRPQEALASFDKALSLKPNYADALYSRGNALNDLKRPEEALASYDKALSLKPDHVEALNNRGKALNDLKRPEEALASYDRALSLKPDHADALNNRGTALNDLKRPEEALASYDKALSLKPDHVEALNNRGTALNDLKRPEEALASYDRALSLKPDHADAHYNRGNALRGLKRPEEALASYDRALSLKPDHQLAFSSQVIAAFQACYWARAGELSDALSAQMAVGQSRITPFSILGFCDDPSAQLACARHYIQKTVHPTPAPLSKRSTRAGGKIRIAYLSADFHRHATAWLTAELFELHNRAKFEVFGISFGKDDRSGIRRRLTKAFDGFHDVQHRSNRDVAQLISDLQIDIAIDLKGYTQDSRPAILAYRPAPVQVSYLGYPGTMGADFIDYLVADRFVAPFDQQPYFAEQIVHLPDSYQVNDTKRSIAASTPTRLASGLPEQGFVYCCFNNNYKITPKLFDVWMRLISGNPGSVLWLLRDNADAERNLRKEAEARGVDSTRLVFAGRLPLDEHLARHRLADLFLDTLPCNAHTTASDALWAELPVLTCMGHSFVSRVASSLLHAVGLPELVTDNLSDYEALARRLSADPVLLGGYKQRLAQNRLTCPLFDSARFTRHIEAAYAKMWELHQRGESPRSLSIEPA